jgi:hypothetical protein
MRKEALSILFCLLLASFLQASVKQVDAAIIVDSITPETLVITLPPGESVTEIKEVMIDAWGLPGATWSGNVTLNIVEEEYRDWLISVNPEYVTATEPSTPQNIYVFNIEIKVPEGTSSGIYEFTIGVYSYPEGGSPYSGATQQITIAVPPEMVIPEFPYGTILGLGMCIAALVVFKSKNIRIKHQNLYQAQSK